MGKISISVNTTVFVRKCSLFFLIGQLQLDKRTVLSIKDKCVGSDTDFTYYYDSHTTGCHTYKLAVLGYLWRGSSWELRCSGLLRGKYRYSLRNKPLERDSQLLRGGSLKSRIGNSWVMYSEYDRYGMGEQYAAENFSTRIISVCWQTSLISPYATFISVVGDSID